MLRILSSGEDTTGVKKISLEKYFLFFFFNIDYFGNYSGFTK